MARPKAVPMSPPAPPPPEREVVLYTEKNPSGVRTVYEMVPEAVQYHMEKNFKEYPELFGIPEKDLMEKIRGKMGNKPHGIGVTEHRLRIAFWMEYDRACEDMLQMKMPRVFGGICSNDYFYQDYLRKPEKMAWLLCPPASYTIAMEESLVYGIDRMRAILDFPLYNKKGEPDTKVGELILKIVHQLDLRLKGAIIQRIQTQSLNVHAHVGKAPPQQEDMTNIDQRLEELEARAEATGRPTVEVKAEGE